MENGQHNVLQPISDDFNAETWQKSLDISAPTGMPSPESLNSVGPLNFAESSESANPATMNPTETSGPTEANNSGTVVSTPENVSQSEPANPLGQITTIENAISTTPMASQPSYEPSNIRTTGDRLEKSSIEEIDKAINELSQTGNLNNFYNEIRGEGSMLETNLSNSFNRKLYDKGEK